ncbi:MAG: transcriptional repressor LexA [Bacillota bacterium]|nr:transcriptional repressor LexA [Bacillota bacterium]
MARRFTRANLQETSDRVYRFIVDYIDENGYAPSVRDICEGVGIGSTSTVHAHLKRLEADGRLTYEAGKRRAITLTEADRDELAARRDQTRFVPLVGTVTAGVPILASESIDRFLPFSGDLFPEGDDLFVLTVRGDSMIDAAILSGDLVICRQTTSAPWNSIVVALIGEEATVKRLVRRDGRPWLQPENENYEPIAFDREDCQLLGEVVGVVRTDV